MPLWMQLLANGGILQQANDGSGGDLGGAEPSADTPPAEDDTPPVEEPPKQPSDDKPKTTDAEAKLLKEIMKRKESERATKAELDALKAQLSGLDLEEARKLIAERKDAEEKALEAKGDYERIKQRMAEEHQNEVSQLKAQIEQLVGERKASQDEIANLTVGTKFSQSAFISTELVLPPAKARTLYGDHFEIEDGQVVGYDKPRGVANRTALVNSLGQALQFDEAMKKIIESDPEKDHLLKSKGKNGAGSHSSVKTKGVQASANLTGQDKIQAGLNGLLAKKS